MWNLKGTASRTPATRQKSATYGKESGLQRASLLRRGRKRRDITQTGEVSGVGCQGQGVGLAAGLGTPDSFEPRGVDSGESLAPSAPHPMPRLSMMYQKHKELVVLRQNVEALYVIQIIRVRLKLRNRSREGEAALHDVSENKWVSDEQQKSHKNLSY